MRGIRRNPSAGGKKAAARGARKKERKDRTECKGAEEKKSRQPVLHEPLSKRQGFARKRLGYTP